jgi:hypothetical protein
VDLVLAVYLCHRSGGWGGRAAATGPHAPYIDTLPGSFDELPVFWSD